MLKIYQMPTSSGSANQGSEDAPHAILNGGLVDQLTSRDIDFAVMPEVSSEHAELPADEVRMRNQDKLVDMNEQLYRQILANTKTADVALVLGGDHSVAIGSFFATKKRAPKAKIVYIDAHPDASSPASTPTGNFHALPVSTALGDGVHGLFNHTPFRYEDITFLGIKDIDKDEWEYIAQNNIRHYTIDAVIEHGLGKIMDEILEWVGDSPLHIGLDIDAIDGQFAPGTGIVNHGGLTYREITYICKRLAAARLCALDVVEVNPRRDVDNKTVHLAIELILSLLGHEWSPYTRYLSGS